MIPGDPSGGEEPLITGLLLLTHPVIDNSTTKLPSAISMKGLDFIFLPATIPVNCRNADEVMLDV